jgi:multidrug efflux pump subunit AcrB
MNKCCKILFFTLFVLISLSYCFNSENYVFAQTDQTASKLQVANSAVGQAFSAVLDAEKAGANVTVLLDQLNYAATILAQAENSDRTGNSTAAAAQADSVLPFAQEVTALAQDAKQAALVSGQNTVWFTLAFTVIVGFVFVLVLFLVWRRFKRGYVDGLSESKPEVKNQ